MQCTIRAYASTWVMRAYLWKDGESSPVALAVRTCRIVYDLWDEVYRIKLGEAGRERDTAVYSIENGVQRQCAEARDLPVVDRSFLEHPRFHGKSLEGLVRAEETALLHVQHVQPGRAVELRHHLQRGRAGGLARAASEITSS